MIHLTLPYAKTKPTVIIQHHCATGKPNDPPNFTVCQNTIPIPILGKSNPAVQPEKQMTRLTNPHLNLVKIQCHSTTRGPNDPPYFTVCKNKINLSKIQ